VGCLAALTFLGAMLGGAGHGTTFGLYLAILQDDKSTVGWYGLLVWPALGAAVGLARNPLVALLGVLVLASSWYFAVRLGQANPDSLRRYWRIMPFALPHLALYITGQVAALVFIIFGVLSWRGGAARLPPAQ